MPAAARFPIGVSLATIGVPFGWWRDGARRLEDAGYEGLWSWDHFTTRGARPNTVLEAWTTLSAMAPLTSRVTLGTFVANVMNRHPAVLARMAATLQEVSAGRLVLGIGIGGHPREHRQYGIPFPDIAERVARLEEAIGVLRALWTGGPVDLAGRFYPLVDAIALPAPDPPPPILVGGQSPAGARLAARSGDGWTSPPERFEELEPIYRKALAEAGRDRAKMRVLVGFEAGRAGEDALAGSSWIADLHGELDRWQSLGADGVILTARTDADIDRLVAAAERW
jgi:alkanesulfonate monooxygenase SsuD/methylene tetrahydromethanopterin reductase-like flavin-dependent oxidoreductase (luciferase family)